MIPKEKAIELHENFSNTANSWIEGKRCAILCVDEILKFTKGRMNAYMIYWQEVKSELEKL